MPPKKPAAPSKKTEQKKKEKVIEVGMRIRMIRGEKFKHFVFFILSG